ncbi:kinase-like protein [Penicillium psychrosexuale]|uniref:kinase-like protein n=1 Tax=Penicillium psychrosexuale TaxID=1002107 RepID=UPI0025456E90|nr:kinase-like protein [Penicillium psychrosexuale]KAJ5799715.1 kinase-like protein [Penicillium psychrosexuale]
MTSNSECVKSPLRASYPFFYNEDLRLRERYVEFSQDGLLREIERHLGPSHGHPIHITKIAEGGFNRVFLSTMEDGLEVIVKIPYPITGPKHYATASEAASMQYLRSKGIPVPKMYGYSSSDTNPARVEYIIMEKASGVGLETRWLSMSKREQHKLASSFVEIEKKLFDLPFRSIGSIYFKKDAPVELQAALYIASAEKCEDSEIFCIGPTADYMFWHGRRAGLNLRRGPWNDPKDYLLSVAQKEIEWTQRSLNRPTLRHPDLNPNNIFVSPDSGAISCIIDWQHTTIEPRLLVAGYPRTFENPDAEETPHLEEPSLPPEYETLPADKKVEADELQRRRLISYYYRIFNGHLNKAHLEALRDPILLPRQHLVDRAGRQWSGNLMTLKGALVRMADYWPHLSDIEGIPCPVRFTDAELDGFYEQEKLWFNINKVVDHWREQIGVTSEDGWVSNEHFEEAVRKSAELESSLIAIAEGDKEDIDLLRKGWPFRDRDEIN